MGKRGRPRHPDILTPREWEVLEFLRERLSNDQIAERLGITLDGAKYHVSQIFSKLGVTTREEAAAWRPEERRAWWARWPLWARIAGAATVLAAAGGFLILAAFVRSSQSEDEIVDTRVNECQFSPGARASKVDQIPTGLDGSAVCWEEVPDAARYSVDLSVTYYGNCDVFRSGAPLSQEAAVSRVSRELERGSNRFEFPRLSDDRYTIPKDVFFDLRAHDQSGSEIARGGFIRQKEIDYPSMCGSSSTQVLANGQEIPFEECGSNRDWVQPPLEQVLKHHYLEGVPADQVRLAYGRHFFIVAGGNGALSANQGWLASTGLAQEGAGSYVDPEGPPWGASGSCLFEKP